MAKFPFSFRTKVSGNDRLDLALATNFDKAATEEQVAVLLTPGDDGSVLTSDSGGVSWQPQAARFKCGSFNPTATGNKVVTGLGFKPGLVRFSVGFNGANTSYAITGEGAMDASGNQWAHGSIYSEVLGGAEAESYTNRCITLPSDGGTNQFIEAQYVSMDDDGFTVNFLEVSSTAFIVCWTAFA